MSTRHFDKEIVDGQQSIVIESTLPPTTSLAALEGEGATVLVFSHDAVLARVIRGVAAERYPTRIINEWSDLLQQVGSGKGRIVLLDVDALSDDVEDALAQVNRCADWLVIIIAAKQQQAQDFMRFWSERRIHRLLIKPAAAGITRLLLESAFARFIELRELHENTDAMEIPQELVEAEEAKLRRRWLWPLLGVVTVALAGTALYFSGLFTAQQDSDSTRPSAEIEDPRIDSSPQQAPAVTTAVVPAAAQGSGEIEASVVTTPAAEPAVDPFADLLGLAERAAARGNVAAPPGNNALEHYATILAQDPAHPIARARHDALLDELFMTAETQLLDQNFAGAQITLDQIGAVQAGGTRLQFLQEQLVRLRDTQSIAAAAPISTPVLAAPTVAPGEVAAEPTELQSMLTLLRLRLSEGQLVAPQGDSARDYLLRALDLGVSDDQIGALAQQFAELAQAALPQALAAGDLNAANTMLATAGAFDVMTPQLQALEAEVAAASAAQLAEEDATLHEQALLAIEDSEFTGGDGSAVALLLQLRERAAEEALVGDVEARLSSALATATRGALSAGQWDRADELLGVLAAAQLEAPVVASLQRDLAIARRQEAWLAEAAPLGEMTVLEAPPAEYPRGALISETTGWVDLHFTVDTAGATTQIEVVGAQPPGRFEEAAVEALTDWRFAPFEFEQHIYARRVQLRMRFELD